MNHLDKKNFTFSLTKILILLLFIIYILMIKNSKKNKPFLPKISTIYHEMEKLFKFSLVTWFYDLICFWKEKILIFFIPRYSCYMVYFCLFIIKKNI